MDKANVSYHGSIIYNTAQIYNFIIEYMKEKKKIKMQDLCKELMIRFYIKLNTARKYVNAVEMFKAIIINGERPYHATRDNREITYNPDWEKIKKQYGET